jgi:CBS domain-containing protein
MTTVGNILKFKGPDVITARPDQSLGDAVKILNKHKIGALVVTGSTGDVVGVLSERDVVMSIAKNGLGSLDRPLSESMTTRVVTCSVHDTIDDIMGRMTHGRFRHIPVVEESQLVGIVSIGDVVKRKIEQSEFEVVALREYITTGY